VVAFDYDVQEGTLHEIQTVSTLPDDYREQNWTADIHVHPTGRFVYASNRGHNSIAIFAVDERSGKLQRLGNAPTLGDMPRNFAIDPTGAYLLAANQNTDSIIVFQIDGKSGKLTQVGPLVEAPTPVCLKFVG
jgi:6-phosphogluconolactonase